MKSNKKLACACLSLILIVALATSASAAHVIFFDSSHATLDGVQVVASADAFSGTYVQSTYAYQSATFTFNAEHAGTYMMWARVYAEHNEDNSWFFSFNGDLYNDVELWVFDYYEASDFEVVETSPLILGGYNTDAWFSIWYWIPVTFRDTEAYPPTRFNLRTFEVREGENTMFIETREIGAKIDQFFMTTDLDFDPNTIDGNLEAHFAAIAAAEAEAQRLEAVAADIEARQRDLETIAEHIEAQQRDLEAYAASLVAVAPAVAADPGVSPETSDSMALVVALSFVILAAAFVLLKRRRA